MDPPVPAPPRLQRIRRPATSKSPATQGPTTSNETNQVEPPVQLEHFSACIDLTADDEVSSPSLLDTTDDDVVCLEEPLAKRSRPLDESGVQIVDTVIGQRPTVIQNTADLPVIIPTATHSNAKTLKCSICLDDFNTIISDAARKLTSTKCGHIFCEECIFAAIRASKECPSCRKKIANAKQTFTVYL